MRPASHRVALPLSALSTQAFPVALVACPAARRMSFRSSCRSATHLIFIFTQCKQPCHLRNAVPRAPCPRMPAEKKTQSPRAFPLRLRARFPGAEPTARRRKKLLPTLPLSRHDVRHSCPALLTSAGPPRASLDAPVSSDRWPSSRNAPTSGTISRKRHAANALGRSFAFVRLNSRTSLRNGWAVRFSPRPSSRSAHSGAR